MYILYVAVGVGWCIGVASTEANCDERAAKVGRRDDQLLLWVHCDIYEVVDDTSAHISMHDAYGGEGAPARGCSCGGGVQR